MADFPRRGEGAGEKMATANVNKNICIGCGTCVSMCPEVFEMGDNNKAHAKAGVECKCNLKDIADACPVSAISVEN